MWGVWLHSGQAIADASPPAYPLGHRYHFDPATSRVFRLREHSDSRPDVDEARRLPHLREREIRETRAAMERRQAEAMYGARSDAKAEGVDTKLLPRSVSTAAGDPRKLRGIPAIGRSVGGAIGGSNPEAEIVRRDGRRRVVIEADVSATVRRASRKRAA